MRFLSLAFMTPVTAMAFAVHAVAPVATSWGLIKEPAWPEKICAALPADIVSRNGSVDFYDADGKDTHPDQARLQAAVDACDGGAVKLVAGPGDGFLTGPLTLKSGVTLWIDKGVTLYASRDPADYDTGAGDCGTANTSKTKSCRSLIEGHDLVGSGLVGDGKIDGRGGSLLLSGPNAGRRSWWDVAYQTKSQGLTQHNFRLVQFDGGRDLTLYRLTFENSPNFHIVPNNFTGITAWGIKVLTPAAEYAPDGYACPDGTTPDKATPATCFTPDTAKNTDGFDPGNSSDVLLAWSYISTGDDNVAIKAGGSAPSHDQVYAHNHFYYGHGMSIGSETNGGADGILVSDLALDGMDSANGNGLRIKSDASRGGVVSHIVYDGVCMRGEVRPLVFDTHYSDATGTLYPDFHDIIVRDFHDLGSVRYGGGTLVFRGFGAGGQNLPVRISLDNVVFDQAAAVRLSAAELKTGPGPVDFAPDPAATGRDCSAAFVPLKSILADSPF